MRPAADARGVAARALPALGSGWARLAFGGAAGLGLVLVAAFAVDDRHRPPGATTVNVMSRRPAVTSTAAVRPVRPPRDQAHDEAAMAYYRVRDKAGAAHVREIIWTPPILRVYTDLSGSDANSRIAIALCRTAAAYLEGRGRAPVVFVHARPSDGYPVLANKTDVGDSCRLGSVP